MSTDQLPPDVQAARKARINSDIIKLCSIKPIYINPTAQGIGLYTHVAGPKTASQNPHFEYADNANGEVALLPLGGPRKIVPSNRPREPLREEVAAVYKELQDAVKAEEKIWSEMRAAADAKGKNVRDAYTMSLDTLKEKYGLVNTPQPESANQPTAQRYQRRHSEASSVADSGALKRLKTSNAPPSDLQRQNPRTSNGGAQTKPERRPSATATGNTYEASRDPRRQGR
ncbi:hypothetical protein EJ07DRAFT_172781 [Lizonia empirigonia]|nr:hypothetical protein EJ07DRAFT_172781 [Lizonia empirigonia]